MENITHREFLDEIKKRILSESIKIEQEGNNYYAYLDEFPNILGHANPNIEKAKEDLYEGLWEDFEFLRENEGRLGMKPKKDLERYITLLGLKK